MQARVKRTVKLNGRDCRPGEIIDLSDVSPRHRKALEGSGYVELEKRFDQEPKTKARTKKVAAAETVNG